jgi:hypothetical protein
VVRGLQTALDAFERGETINPSRFLDLTEGGTATTGAYGKTWR